MSFKSCVVPQCQTTSLRNPDKHFFSVPSNPQRRKRWLTACRIDPSYYSVNSHLDVCQDHFKLEEDAENFVEVMICPDRKLRIRPTALPHIFQCQPGRTAAQPEKERPASAKRARKSLVEGLLTASTTSSGYIDPTQEQRVVQEEAHPILTEEDHPILIEEEHPILTEEEEPPVDYNICAGQAYADVAIQVGLGMVASADKKTQTKSVTTANKRCQVFMKPQTVSRAIQCHVYVRSKAIQCDLGQESYVKIQCDLGQDSSVETGVCLSGRTPVLPNVQSIQSSDSSSPIRLSGKSSSSWSPGSEGEELLVKATLERAKLLRDLNIKLCKQNPMYYLGIPDQNLWVLEALRKCIPTDEVNVIMCLKKIRLDRVFKELSDDFEVSESYATKIFERVVPQLAECLEKLLLWPNRFLIKQRLPINFRARYSHVQSIIDCFEILIEKPSDPILQTLTWSSYKNGNTLKVLISITPDGLINFVSKAKGGRISDLKITEQSGYLDVLPRGAGVMADRGFKGIWKLLEEKGCVLIRPPSVQKDQKSSKNEVKESKRIASLRIHVERVIRREREFSMLEPHACINHNLIKYVDYVVTIACGLVNLQKPIMKKHV